MTSPSVKSTLIHVIEGEWEREKGGEMWGIVLSYSISSPLLVPWQWEKRNSGNKWCSGPRTDMTYIWLSKCTSSFPIGPLEGVTGGLTVHLHVSVLGEKTLCQSNPPMTECLRTSDTRVFCWGEPFGIHMEPITLMYIVLSVIKTYGNGQEVKHSNVDMVK